MSRPNSSQKPILLDLTYKKSSRSKKVRNLWFSISLHSSWILNWLGRLCANHAGPSYIAVKEIRVIVQDQLLFISHFPCEDGTSISCFWTERIQYFFVKNLERNHEKLSSFTNTLTSMIQSYKTLPRMLRVREVYNCVMWDLLDTIHHHKLYTNNSLL